MGEDTKLAILIVASAVRPRFMSMDKDIPTVKMKQIHTKIAHPTIVASGCQVGPEIPLVGRISLSCRVGQMTMMTSSGVILFL